MLKLLKYALFVVILIVSILLYGVYSWHFRQKPTFLSVERQCDLIEYAKEICTNDDNEINEECFYGRVPKEGMGYLIRDFVFGHTCIDDEGTNNN